MSTVPAEIAGIGSTQQKLRVSPKFDPLKASVGPEEYFVLSRIDGSQTLREVLLTTGLPLDRSIAIIARLRSIGALLLPNETAAPTPPAVSAKATPNEPLKPSALPRAATPVTTQSIPRTATSPTPQSKSPTGTGSHPAPPRSSGSGSFAIPRTMTPLRTGAGTSEPSAPSPMAAPVHAVALPDPTADELSALAEDNALGEPERRRILAMARLVHEGADAHAILGVPKAAAPRDLKLAYFQLSKEIHPDRYYGKKLGSFGPRMALVFEAASRAYARLTQPDKTRSSGTSAVKTDARADEQPQTPQEYAAELFDRACQLEVGGDPLEAMKLFAASVRVDPQARYLRRAASCALAAGQPRSAVEYAKKAHAMAPTDPSAARLLAGAFRAAGKLADAEEVLVMAMALKNENDALTSELRNDLAEVRRLLAG